MQNSELKRLGLNIGLNKERESVRQCFLFSNHLILTSRTQGGKLHLVENVGKIPLADITLIEDPNEENGTEEQGKATHAINSCGVGEI